MHFSLIRASDSLHRITGSPPGTFRNLSEQRMGQLCSGLDYSAINDIIEQGLHQYIDRFQRQLNLVGEAIRDDFFTPYNSPPSQPSINPSDLSVDSA